MSSYFLSSSLSWSSCILEMAQKSKWFQNLMQQTTSTYLQITPTDSQINSFSFSSSPRQDASSSLFSCFQNSLRRIFSQNYFRIWMSCCIQPFTDCQGSCLSEQWSKKASENLFIRVENVLRGFVRISLIIQKAAAYFSCRIYWRRALRDYSFSSAGPIRSSTLRLLFQFGSTTSAADDAYLNMLTSFTRRLRSYSLTQLAHLKRTVLNVNYFGREPTNPWRRSRSGRADLAGTVRAELTVEMNLSICVLLLPIINKNGLSSCLLLKLFLHPPQHCLEDVSQFAEGYLVCPALV